MIPSPKLITLGFVWDLSGVENSDYLQLSAETVNEVVPAAVHAVEDEEDVEDDHLDDHMDEGNFNEVVMDEGYQQAEQNDKNKNKDN